MPIGRARGERDSDALCVVNEKYGFGERVSVESRRTLMAEAGSRLNPAIGANVVQRNFTLFYFAFSLVYPGSGTHKGELG